MRKLTASKCGRENTAKRKTTGEDQSMNQMMNGQGDMMWGMGWGGILIGALVVLSIAALVKYLVFDRK